jgi:hypothetical protein
MNELGRQAAQEGAVAVAATRELIPYPGGLAGRLAFAHEQIRRRKAGEEPIPERDVLWRESP